MVAEGEILAEGEIGEDLGNDGLTGREGLGEHLESLRSDEQKLDGSCNLGLYSSDSLNN